MAAVIFLSAAACGLFKKETGELLTAADYQTESSDVPENDNSNRQVESEAAGPEDEITGLRCSVQLGALVIVEGGEFHVSELNGSDYEAYIENSTYIVKGSTTHDNHIVVTVPADFQFENIELAVTGGVLTAENITTRNLYTNCDKGAINYSGYVDAGAEIEQFQGKTVLNIDGEQTDYNYNLDVNMGHIGIGEQQYAGPDQYQSIDNSAEKTIAAYCTMGSISILFSEAD